MKKYLFAILLFISQFIVGQDLILTKDSLTFNAENNWRFSNKIKEDLSQLDYNDSKLFQVNSINESKELEKVSYNGTGWFRFKFRSDSSLVDKALAIALDFGGASEVYLDGKILKKYGTIKGKENSEYYNPKNVPEVFFLKDTGLHVIAIKVQEFIDDDDENYLGFDLKIGNSEDLIETKNSDSVGFTLVISFIGVLFFTLGIIHLFFFLYYRSIISNLFFSLFMFGLAAGMTISFISFFSNEPKQISTLSQIIYYLVATVSLFFHAFIHYTFYEKTKIWLLLFSLLTLFSFIAIYFNLEEFEFIPNTLIFGALLHSLVRIIISLVKKQKGAWIIGVGILFSILFSFFLFTIGLLGGVEINSNNLTGRIFLVGLALSIISIPLSMSIYQAWSFSNLYRDLSKQLVQVKNLSEKTIQQEKEKKQILENQKAELEIKVEERTYQLKEEKKKSDDLLLNILPEEIAEELKLKGVADAQLIEEVTVLFTDFKGFTAMAEKLSPKELVHDIHECFSEFDKIMEKYGIEKIKTIGDAYMAAGGLPTPNKTHAHDVVKAALEIATFIETGKANKILKGLSYFEIRIGVHTGPVVAGIVGIKKFAYDIWGDTVNTASRMESSGEIGKINISETTKELIKNDFKCNYRGEIEAKGKGKIKMYFVEGVNSLIQS
jgi:class 3 adenylate cyclase